MAFRHEFVMNEIHGFVIEPRARGVALRTLPNRMRRAARLITLRAL